MATSTPPSWLQSAAQNNLGYVQNLENQGFQPYTGQQVANFSPLQQQSFGTGAALANSTAAPLTSNFNTGGAGPTFAAGQSPYWSGYGATPPTSGAGPFNPGTTGGMPVYSPNAPTGNFMPGGYSPNPNAGAGGAGGIGGLAVGAATAGPASVGVNSISSQMSPYLNQYVNYALAPQLQAEQQQFAGQNKSFDSAATGAGAFGDTSWGIGRTNLTNQQDIANQGLVGNAYNAAFNTAIGAGAQDVASQLAANTTNANLYETGLQRQLAGANQLFGLGSGATNLQNTLGGQQTAQQQAQLNAQYNQWLMAQQYPFQVGQLANQTLTAARAGAPITTTGYSTGTTQAPNNAGYGILGSLIGAAPGLIGSNPGTTPAGGTTGGSGLLGWYGSGNGNYAEGGPAQGGKPIMVGERGPELFVPGSSGVVIPNEVLTAARAKRAQKLGRPDGLASQLGIAA